MAARFKFFFDNTEVSEPLNWSDMSVSITRQDNGILIQQDSDVQFTADSYEYLYSKSVESGFCGQVIYKIYEDFSMSGNYELTDTGIIFISDCEFDLDMCICRCKLQDDGFYSKINNNKSIETSVVVGKSKLGNDITPVNRFSVEFFEPATGTYSYDCYVYTVYDALRYYIDFMSDGEIGFESTILDTGGEFEGMCFTVGYELYYQDNAQSGFENVRRPFSEIIETVCRLLNLGWWLERDSANNPVFRIEDKDYFYASSIAFNLDNVKGITKRYAKDKLYATVTLGSSDTNDDVNYTFPENISFNGFIQEQYQMLSNCNIDANLDLTSNIITSSNVIEAAVTASDDSYNDGLFLVDVDMTTLKAVASDWLGTPDVYYNERLNNANVLKRSVGYVPNEIANYLTAVSPLFQAAKTSNQNIAGAGTVLTEPIAFQNDSTGGNFDTDNVWNTTTYEFTAPIAGLYTIDVSLILDNLLAGSYSGYIKYRVYDVGGFAGGNLYDTYENAAITVVSGVQTKTDTYQCFIPQGYKLVMALELTGLLVSCNIKTLSTVACTASDAGNNILETNDPSKFPIEIYTFDYPLSKNQYDTIKDSPNQKITVNDGKNYLDVWVDKIEYSRNTGMTKFALINITT